MDKNIIPALLILIVSILGLVAAINTSGSVTSDTGEKYEYHYSKCERFVGGAKGVSHCSKYIPAVEYRIKTLTKGVFFDYEGYRIVSK